MGINDDEGIGRGAIEPFPKAVVTRDKVRIPPIACAQAKGFILSQPWMMGN